VSVITGARACLARNALDSAVEMIDAAGAVMGDPGSECATGIRMTSESQLREKLLKIEALFVGAGTAGERLAAEAALQRVRAWVEELARHDPPIEQQFSLPDRKRSSAALLIGA
jgi:hypothetical protein